MVQPILSHPSRRGQISVALTALTALLLALGAVLALTGPASAAGGATKASATLTLDGPAAKRLRAAGVRVTATRKATLRRTTVTLPVSVAVVGTTAAVGLDGTITFKAGKRKVTLSGVRVMVAKSRTVKVLARTTGGQFAILTGTVAKKTLTLDAFRSTAAFGPTPVRLTSRAATLLRKGLQLRRTPTGTLGALRLLAATPTGPTTTPVVTTPPSGPTPTTPTTPTVPKVCEPTGKTDAMAEPDFDAPRPLTAVDVQSACVTWHPKDSWTNYINTGEGATLSAGATADPSSAICGAPSLPRDFHFQFDRGWFDPATGRAVLQYDGAIRYRYFMHGIDITFRNPEVQVGGAAASQVTFRPASGSRLAVLDIDPAAVVPAPCATAPGPQGAHNPAGGTYERIKSTVAATAAPIFAGAGGSYPPGTEFGWLSVSFTPAS